MSELQRFYNFNLFHSIFQWGWDYLVSLPNSSVKAVTHVSQSMTVFKYCAFKEVIKLNEAVREGPNPI